MLNGLISAEMIDSAYESQIENLVELAMAENKLAAAKYQLEKAMVVMYLTEGFVSGKNDTERTIQIERYCGPENEAVKLAQMEVDKWKNTYRTSSLEIEKYQTLIKYMEAVKDLPQFPM